LHGSAVSGAWLTGWAGTILVNRPNIAISLRYHLATLAAFAVLVAGCRETPGALPETSQPSLVEQSGVAMATELRLTAWTADKPAARSAFEEVLREFDRLDARMSVWREGSDILRINASAGERPVAVDAETRDLLRTARQVSEWTGGNFDVTYAALSDLWK